MLDATPLKDRALNRERIEKIAAQIASVHPGFEPTQFARDAQLAFPELALKDRVAWTSTALGRLLPADFPEAVRILLASLPTHPDDHSDFGSYQYAPHSDFVARYGCRAEFLATSLDALKTLTVYFSAEGAMRRFINEFPAQTMAAIERWAADEDHRVRRLTSECTRPRLPWATKVDLALTDALPVLDKLFCDSSRFVTRSVANHVNDIAAKDPNLALAILGRWRESGRQSPKEMDFIARQGLRQLIKSGCPPAFEFLGCSPAPQVTVVAVRTGSNVVRIGASLDFEVELVARQGEQVVVDYALAFPNRNGTGYRHKVFKLRTVSMSPGERLVLTKKHPMRQLSTRTLQRGRHLLTIQVNGTRAGTLEFDLTG